MFDVVNGSTFLCNSTPLRTSAFSTICLERWRDRNCPVIGITPFYLTLPTAQYATCMGHSTSVETRQSNWGEPERSPTLLSSMHSAVYLGRAQRSPTWTIYLGFSIYYWGERSEAPHGRYIWDFPYMIYVYIYYYQRTSDRSNFAWRRTARDLLCMLIVV